jgi:hypothetical protein
VSTNLISIEDPARLSPWKLVFTWIVGARNSKTFPKISLNPRDISRHKNTMPAMTILRTTMMRRSLRKVVVSIEINFARATEAKSELL